MRTMNDSLVEMGMKDHHEGSKKLDVDAIEDPKLVGMVEKRIANLNKLTGREPGKNPAVSDVDDFDPTPEGDTDDDVEGGVEDGVEDDDQAVSDVDDGSTPGEGDADDDTDDDKKEAAAEIPDAYVRAAVHSGWSEDDIEALAKANPKVAKKTFENLYNSTNKASREWAAIGRASRMEADKMQQANKADSENKLEYGNIDLNAIKKEFDLDPAVERIIESSNARDKKLTDALNSIMGDKPEADTRTEVAARGYDAATEAANEQHINNFFDSESLAPYKDFYGELPFGQTWEQLPSGQARNRYAVYETADLLLAGTTMRGAPMGLSEALERAHLLVTENVREKAIRSEIKKTSTKRKNSMVFAPSEGKRKGGSGGKPKTKNELEQKVAGFIQTALKK